MDGTRGERTRRGGVGTGGASHSGKAVFAIEPREELAELKVCGQELATLIAHVLQKDTIAGFRPALREAVKRWDVARIALRVTELRLAETLGAE